MKLKYESPIISLLLKGNKEMINPTNKKAEQKSYIDPREDDFSANSKFIIDIKSRLCADF